jgi:hypothetical protein
MKRFLIFPLVVILCIAFFPSCEKIYGETDLFMETRFRPGGNPWDSSATYLVQGTTVRFSDMRFYLSGFEVHWVESVDDVDGALLIHPQQSRYYVGRTVASEYHNFYCKVGLIEDLNHLNPGRYAGENPLGLQEPSMHWNQTDGYIFLRLEGEYDSDGDGAPDTPFHIHLGGDDNLSFCDIYPWQVDGSNAEEVTVRIDFDPLKLFANLDFPAESSTQTWDFPGIAATVSSNVPGSFSKGW